MRIIIKRFRCYIDKTFSLPDVGTILVQGQSGKGKSTIFNSIYWCLYGSVPNIYPQISNDDDDGSSYVRLELPNTIIYRQAKPNLLQITLNNITMYEDATAQSIINSTFGTKELWYTCCYLEQGNRCGLLSGSHSKKMTILNSLAFAGEDPQEYISSINLKLKQQEDEVKIKESIYREEKIRYDKIVKEENPDMSKLISTNNLIVQKTRLKSLQDEYSKLLNEQLHQREQIGIRTTLLSSKESMTIEYNNIKHITKLDVDNIRKRIQLLIGRRDIEFRLKRLNSERASLGDVDISKLCSIIYTEEDYMKTANTENNYNFYMNICNGSLNISYDTETINRYINEWSIIISREKERKPLLLLKDKLISELNSLNSKSFNESQLDNIVYTNKEYMDNLHLEDRYNRNMRMILDVSPTLKLDNNSIQQYLSQLINLRTNIENIHSIYNQINNITNDLHLHSSKINEFSQIDDNNTYTQDDLYKTQILEKEYNEQIQLFNKWNIAYDSNELEKRISHLQSIINSQVGLTEKWNRKNQQNKILQEIESLPSIDNTLDGNEISSKISELESELSKYKMGRGILSCPHCKGGVRYVNGELHPSDNYIENIEDKIKTTETSITGLKYDLQIYQKKSQLSTQLDTVLYNIDPSTLNNLPELITEYQLNQYQNELNNISRLKIIEQPKVTSSYISNQIELRKARSIYQELQERHNKLNSDYNNLYHSIVSIDQYNMNTSCNVLDSKIDILKRVEVLSPPKVSSSYIHDQIEMRSIYNKRRDIELQLGEINNKLDKWKDIQVLNDSELESINNNLSKLLNVIVIDKPNPTAKYIKEQIDLRNKYNSILQLEGQIKAVTQSLDNNKNQDPENSDCSQERINNLSDILSNYEASYNRKKQLEQEIHNIEVQLSQLKISPTLDERIAQKKIELDNKEYDVVEGEKAMKINNMLEVLQTKYNEIELMNNKVTGLQRLKDTALKTECRLLQSTIDHINHTLSEILPGIFDDPIYVKLSTTRELKSKKNRTKIDVNISIQYKGMKYDKVSQMSGGEGDRVSLAIIIALNKVSPSRLLLIDEALSSLDPEFKCKAITSLKQNMPSNKLVLCIDHSSVEGYYDYSFNLNELMR